MQLPFTCPSSTPTTWKRLELNISIWQSATQPNRTHQSVSPLVTVVQMQMHVKLIISPTQQSADEPVQNPYSWKHEQTPTPCNLCGACAILLTGAQSLSTNSLVREAVGRRRQHHRDFTLFYLRLDQSSQFINRHRRRQPCWIRTKPETCNLHF